MTDPESRLARWAPILLMAAGVLAAWSIVIAITGGALVDLGPVRLSSRNPTRPMLLAVLLAAIAWRLAYRERLELRLQRLAVKGRATGPLLVSVAAISVFGFAWFHGIRAAGGSDPFGYVSESALFLQGHLKVDQGIVSEVPWPNAEGSLAPLGYRAASDTRIMVPTYAPGLPLMMSIGRMVSSCSPYYVSPICGALIVVLTYLLGRRFFSPATGVVGAVLTAASPTVLFMSMFPMADLPSAACWIAALLVAGPSSGRAVAAAVLTGLAVAIRPNLVPLAVFPWLLSMVGGRGTSTGVKRTVAFAAGLAPFVTFVAWTNAYLYGSPFSSGYGPLSPGFAAEHAGRNLIRYPSWWLESQGILAFLFVASLVQRPAAHRREISILMAFAAAVLLCYVFYIPFESWWYLRFLLPAIPLTFLFCADVIRWATSRFSLAAQLSVLLLFTLAVLNHTLAFNRRIGLSQIGEGEQKYVDAGVFVDRVTPPNAVVVALQHSGSVRYYSGRLTLRYDNLDPEWLDRAVHALERHGRPVYLLLDDAEEPGFRKRFEGQRSLAALDRGPVATGRAGQLLFYTINAAPFEQSSPRIPRIPRSECPDMSPGFLTAGRKNSER